MHQVLIRNNCSGISKCNIDQCMHYEEISGREVDDKKESMKINVY